MTKELLYRISSSIVLLPIVFFCIIKGSYFFNILILFFFLVSCFEWNSISKSKKLKVIGIIFLCVSYSTIYLIRNKFNEESLNLFLIITLICISTDLGGFIFGKLLKGPKLTKISPNKTYSGMFGSFLLSTVILIIFLENSNLFNFSNKIFDFSFLIILLSISGVSQFGDLVVSYFKRKSKMKDTGRIIPGHGGILDRTDGMIFAFPFSYVLITLNIL